jgi:hypothetical protein
MKCVAHFDVTFLCIKMKVGIAFKTSEFTIHTFNHYWGYLMLFCKVMEALVQGSIQKNVLHLIVYIGTHTYLLIGAKLSRDDCQPTK